MNKTKLYQTLVNIEAINCTDLRNYSSAVVYAKGLSFTGVVHDNNDGLTNRLVCWARVIARDTAQLLTLCDKFLQLFKLLLIEGPSFGMICREVFLNFG